MQRAGGLPGRTGRPEAQLLSPRFARCGREEDHHAILTHPRNHPSADAPDGASTGQRDPGPPRGSGHDPHGWTEETLTVEGHRVFYPCGPEVARVPRVHVRDFAISGFSFCRPLAR